MASYWDIDDYLAGEELVQVKSLPSVLQSYLSPTSEPPTTLPLYLAQALDSRSLCEAVPPPYLSHPYQSTLNSSPDLLNLSNLSPCFYSLSSYFGIKDPSLVKILCCVFLNRLQKLFKHVGVGNLNKEISKLTCLELRIWELLRKTDCELGMWKERKHERVARNFQLAKGGQGFIN